MIERSSESRNLFPGFSGNGKPASPFGECFRRGGCCLICSSRCLRAVRLFISQPTVEEPDGSFFDTLCLWKLCVLHSFDRADTRRTTARTTTGLYPVTGCAEYPGDVLEGTLAQTH